jgi:AcrR family transcriptional regulator
VPSGTRKERQKEELRAKILEVSRQIVVNEGIAALTIRRVAKEVEYSPGALYLYFANREAIVAELGKQGLGLLLGYLRTSEKIADPSARLKALAKDYIRFAAENPETYQLVFMLNQAVTFTVFHGESPKDDSHSGAGDEAFALLVQPFAQLRASHPAWKKKDPVECAEVLWSCLHGIAALGISCGNFLKTPADVLVRQVTDSLLRE